MGYVAEKSGDVHFVTVGVDQEKEHENADAFYFTFDGEDIAVGSVSRLAFDVEAAVHPFVSSENGAAKLSSCGTFKTQWRIRALLPAC